MEGENQVRAINKPLQKKLNRYALGVSNRLFDTKNHKFFTVQFYDMDVDYDSIRNIYDSIRNILSFESKKLFGGLPLLEKPKSFYKYEFFNRFYDIVLKIFPYDCIVYETRDGFHFISFAYLKGTRLTRARAVEMSKALGNQDYWTLRKDLCLRVSPKWNWMYSEKSPKPVFFRVVKEPVRPDLCISGKHLDFYVKFMNLPLEVAKLYDNCKRLELPVRTYSYRTRD